MNENVCSCVTFEYANRKLNWNGADFTGIDEVQLDGTSGLLSHAIISEKEKSQRKTKEESTKWKRHILNQT